MTFSFTPTFTPTLYLSLTPPFTHATTTSCIAPDVLSNVGDCFPSAGPRNSNIIGLITKLYYSLSDTFRECFQALLWEME